MAASRIDRTGRVYIPSKLREALGMSPNEHLEVNVEGERIIVERKKSSLAVKGRGLFKVKRRAIREGSLKTVPRELRDIRSR